MYAAQILAGTYLKVMKIKSETGQYPGPYVTFKVLSFPTEYKEKAKRLKVKSCSFILPYYHVNNMKVFIDSSTISMV